ncbi:MAG: adenylate/guanylate cyclase domain-containing protein [Hyphomicrobiales bacterium]|nr:adenylate/guanylate cyclase domain-containing protein [Hyphomicrobiales bacterium]
MINRTQKKLILYVTLIGLSVVCGPIYGLIFIPDLSNTPLWPMALDGAIGGSLLWGCTILLWPSRICAPLRRLAFPWHIILLLALVALCIPLTGSISSSIQSGKFVLILGFGPGWTLYLYILAIATLTLVIIQIAQVIGPRILGNMLMGRYHDPVEERRIFLFIDLIGSTALARQLGDLGTQRLLTRYFFDLGQPVAEHGGEIHAYVGDEAIITWPFEKGADEGRCIRCFFAVQDRLKANAETYKKMFGEAPGIRAGLHGGHVVISECGDTKKSIVYFGDTMNTSARLEGEAKRLEKDLIVSAELLQAIRLPSEFTAEPLGDVKLHGHTSPTALVALSGTEIALGVNEGLVEGE